MNPTERQGAALIVMAGIRTAAEVGTLFILARILTLLGG